MRFLIEIRPWSATATSMSVIIGCINRGIIKMVTKMLIARTKLNLGLKKRVLMFKNK